MTTRIEVTAGYGHVQHRIPESEAALHAIDLCWCWCAPFVYALTETHYVVDHATWISRTGEVRA